MNRPSCRTDPVRLRQAAAIWRVALQRRDARLASEAADQDETTDIPTQGAA